MVDLAVCNLSHDFGSLKDFIVLHKNRDELKSQHSTFEVNLLITAESILEQLTSSSVLEYCSIPKRNESSLVFLCRF